MNKLLELDAKKIKKMIYGKSAEIADKVGMRKGLLSKKINGHTIITLEEINRMAVALKVDTLEILKRYTRIPPINPKTAKTVWCERIRRVTSIGIGLP